MQTLNWTATEARAKRMTDEQLTWAIDDCITTAQLLGPGEQIGKDQGYYHDEASVYRQELNRRRPRAIGETI